MRDPSPGPTLGDMAMQQVATIQHEKYNTYLDGRHRKEISAYRLANVVVQASGPGADQMPSLEVLF